ncbi:mechanosensitive ion channel family protein [Ureibacillus acetophenoni]|uniref:Mechanosensing system component YbdG n=1 Tax=Ureibacillus acetophenoni TaxID=614649 RepID=A0A285U2A4_9BACL|nr:mechanosensitive ion channel family protein [Ureibacillus acetophenoni]SOC35843.1 miniconductance mechanosensitive channel [Ureibacillus acetophenoni]
MGFIHDYLLESGFDDVWADYLALGILILAIILLCIIANFITKKVVMRFITHIINNNKYKWDNILLERKVFHKLSHVVPAIIIHYFATSFTGFTGIIQKFAVLYIIIVAMSVINSLLNALNDIYQTYEISKVRPIKGYIQVAKIVLFIIGTIIIIANLMGESPVIILSGIGALSAVLMLIFRDSILGFVAGVQLSGNDMVRVGDWIEMPKFGANGDVIDISLNTVKVQNFDRTITMIPSYALISDSFINWRGMQASGGRRLKRSLLIDTTSISFCSPELIEKCKNIHYLQDYIIDREKEITNFNIKNKFDRSNSVNGRALTNIGVFRAYIGNYLQNHPGINKESTLMVRQLEPTENGLPLEIYAFANTTVWAQYETIQSDIFDHLFAVAPEFGIRIFQNPSGDDLKTALANAGNNETSK